jgi:hypothetical protein
LTPPRVSILMLVGDVLRFTGVALTVSRDGDGGGKY